MTIAHKATGVFPSYAVRGSAVLDQSKRMDLDVLERLCDYFNCGTGDLLILQPQSA